MSAAPLQQNPLFDKKLITAFVDGVTKTLSTMATTPATPQKPFIEKTYVAKGEIAGMVGMVAPPLRGQLLISYSKGAILQIYENMIGEKREEIDQDIKDAVGELTNQIYGSAKTTLNQMGYKFEMAIPTVIHGHFTVYQENPGATLVIPFELSNKSVFFVEISVTS
jgi:chemotaxis protein CheX